MDETNTIQDNGKQYRVKEGKTFNGFNGLVVKSGALVPKGHMSFIRTGLHFGEIEEVEPGGKKPKEPKEPK
jgi:hypothetical protein